MVGCLFYLSPSEHSINSSTSFSSLARASSQPSVPSLQDTLTNGSLAGWGKRDCTSGSEVVGERLGGTLLR